MNYLAGEITDVKTLMVFSEFLKSGTGEYLSSRAWKNQNRRLVPTDNPTQVRHGVKATMTVFPREFANG